MIMSKISYGKMKKRHTGRHMKMILKHFQGLTENIPKTFAGILIIF